jgi:hypothetical protein
LIQKKVSPNSGLSWTIENVAEIDVLKNLMENSTTLNLYLMKIPVVPVIPVKPSF